MQSQFDRGLAKGEKQSWPKGEEVANFSKNLVQGKCTWNNLYSKISYSWILTTLGTIYMVRLVIPGY